MQEVNFILMTSQSYVKVSPSTDRDLSNAVLTTVNPDTPINSNGATAWKLLRDINQSPHEKWVLYLRIPRVTVTLDQGGGGS
jgi:hypothetical protein